MPPKRVISERAIGKHIGHACEGHLRGLLSHLSDISPDLVTRQLPFEFPVNPDAVILNNLGRIRTVLIIAFWDDSKSSEKKFYRTRLEYMEMQRARQEQPQWFANDCSLITVIYGSANGWKEQILQDLKVQCSPFLFLPHQLGIEAANNIVTRAFTIYQEMWEDGSSNTREKAEEYFVTAEVTAEEQALLDILSPYLSGEQKIADEEAFYDSGMSDALQLRETHVTAAFSLSALAHTAYVPSSSFSTRLRQGLGILSLFPVREVEQWLSNDQRLANDDCIAFARRAFFLDMGEFRESKRLVGSEATFFLHRPVQIVGNQEVYAPGLPDFQDWTRLELALVTNILAAHRKRTERPTSVFKGGTYDQIAGNWFDICNWVANFMPAIIDAITYNRENQFLDALTSEVPVTAEIWHPAHRMAWHYPLWAFVACALSIVQNQRQLRSKYDARRQSPPTDVEAKELFAECYQQFTEIAIILKELTSFAEVFAVSNTLNLCKLQRPRLLSIDEPCSWLADFYNTLTTNSSHNPLNEVVHSWLHSKFPNLEWYGWPKKRSCSLEQVLSTTTGRRQWQFIGLSRAEKTIYAAEVKSITQNNWGNKSKELYDRVAETRLAAASIGWQCHTVCVLDGDVGPDQLSELRTGIGHDEIRCIDEVLADYQSIIKQSKSLL